MTKAQHITKSFKNTRYKQFLKVQAGLDDDARLGIQFSFNFKIGIPLGGVTRWGSNQSSFTKLLKL
jgi:hypothetical protein